MTNNNNPWAGLASYEDPAKSERKLKFCGRDNDIYDVTRLIDDNLLLILYGKSGIGKTSLLNAGVFPKLRLEQYLPVSIRLGTLEANASYQEAIISAIEKAIADIHGSKTTYSVVEEQTDNQQPDCLWNYFARHRFANAEGQPLFLVVVLDQFEEVLRNTSPEHVGKAQTLLNQLQYLIDENHALSDCIVDDKEYFYDFNFRFVISIREDELYLLEDNIDDLSLSMFRNCRYRLRSLSEQGAAEAILIPGKDCIAEDEQQAILDRIIKLSMRPQSNDIDTLLLSLVCAGTYDKKASNKITLSDLAVWKINPMEVYYQDAVKGLSANHVRYIQQHLIREDGSRKRVNAEEVKAALGESTFNSLIQGENRMLVLGERGQVELLHDQLALAVYEERKAFEAKRRRNIFLIISVIALTIAGIFFFQNYKLKKQQWKIMEDQSKFVAMLAHTLVDEGNSYTATKLLLDVMPKDLTHIDKPLTKLAEHAFRESANYTYDILFGHTDWVNSVAFSADGKQIISASKDGTVRIWDTKSNELLQTITGNYGIVYSASFSPDGKQIVFASSDNTIRILDAETTTEIMKLEGHTSIVKSVIYSPNGRLIVSASVDKTVRVWDAMTGTEILRLEGHTEGVNYAVFSPDGKQIVSASDDFTIKIWDAASGRFVKSLEEHTNSVNSVSFSMDGGKIVSTSDDCTIKIWDIALGQAISTMAGHTEVFFASFSPDGKQIASACNGGEIGIWDVESGIKIRALGYHDGSVTSIAFSPDGKRIASASIDRTLIISDVDATGQSTQWLIGHSGSVYSASFSPNGEQAVSASSDGTIRIWDTKSGLNIRTLKGHSSIVLSAAFSPDGKQIVSASADKTVCIWEVETGQLLQTLKKHSNSVSSAAYSPDGKQIVSASLDSTIRIWDVVSGQSIRTLSGHADRVTSASFSPDGKQIVSASFDRTIRVWDTQSGQIIHTLSHPFVFSSAVFSPDGKQIASTYNGESIIIWDVELSQPIQRLVGDTECRFYSASFSPDGKQIVSASEDGIVRIWDVESGMLIRALEGHYDEVFSTSFSPNGRQVISASRDRTMIIWGYTQIISLQDLINQTRERFKDQPLTPEERRMYYLE